jgi:outer membrane lipoprotein-sorting protein
MRAHQWTPVLLSVCALMWGTTVQAESLPEQAVQAWADMAAVHTLEADFRQERRTHLLSRPLVSTGQLRFKRPDNLAWTVLTPAPSSFVMRGTKIGMAYPALGVREQIDLGSSLEARRLVEGLMIWLQGDLNLVLQSYKVSWTDSEPARAILTPKDEGVLRILTQIELEITGHPPQVQTIRMTEPDGDVVIIELMNRRTDVVIPAKAFLLP